LNWGLEGVKLVGIILLRCKIVFDGCLEGFISSILGCEAGGVDGFM